MSFLLEPLNEGHFERLHLLFDEVCREERYLAFTEAGSREKTFAYYSEILSARHTHFVALKQDRVIGWCDVVPLYGQMRVHCGVLGMAVAATDRGTGVGTALITAALGKASDKGLSRVELTVHAENIVAQSLYKKVGFEFEGTQRRGWCLRGQYFDVHYMARLT
jgi:ribosomal protein S18 acetylase RimI-like enzyme